MIQVKIKRLWHCVNLPCYATPGSSGMDLRAAIERGIILSPGKRLFISTGLSMEIPEGYEGQIRPRSGWAGSRGITVINTPGTIDSDYRGEILVALVNLGESYVTIYPGDKIAQIVFAPIERAELIEVSELDCTQRGQGGFGSTD